MVLISFLMLFWPQKVVVTPWGHPQGGVYPKNTFLAKKWTFDLISSKLRIRFWWFLCKATSWCVYISSKLIFEKILVCPPEGFLYPKNPFLAKKWLLSLYLPNAAINFSNFWYGNYPCGFLWENHSVYAGKILVRPLGGIFDPKNVKKSPPKIVIF